MAGIEDEVLALDFDLACALRLQFYDNQQEMARFKALASILGGAFGGGSGGDEPVVEEW